MNKIAISKKLLIIFFSYLIILALFLIIYRYVVLSSWNELWKALVIPRVWASIAIAVGFLAGVLVIFIVALADSVDILLPAGLTLWLLAFISLILTIVVPIDPSKQFSLTGLLFATISMGTGLISLGLTNRSKSKTIAVANHGIYEKMAIIQLCILDLNKSYLDAGTKSYADKTYYEIKAAKELERSANPEVARELDSEIKRLIDTIPAEEKYEYLKNRLTEIIGNETMSAENVSIAPQNKKPLKRLSKLIKNVTDYLKNISLSYIRGDLYKISNVIFVIGFVIWILAVNTLHIYGLSVHIKVNIGIPIAILIFGYIPHFNPQRKIKRSWKEMLERQLYLLEKLLLAFFIALNIRPLLDLFPKNNQYQITVMLTSIMLMLILLYKVITYRDKESVEIQKPKSN